MAMALGFTVLSLNHFKHIVVINRNNKTLKMFNNFEVTCNMFDI